MPYVKTAIKTNFFGHTLLYIKNHGLAEGYEACYNWGWSIKFQGTSLVKKACRTCVPDKKHKF